MVDEFIRILYDKKIVNAQLDIRRSYMYPSTAQNPGSQADDKFKLKQIDISDQIRQFSL